MNHYEYLTIYARENWPMIAFVLVATGGGVAWVKRQLLDNVFATKAEVRLMTDELEAKMQTHENKDNQRYLELTRTMGDNHDEMKDLVISLLGKKDG